MSDKVNEMSCNEDSDAELFNQCEQLEAQLSQSQNDDVIVILSDDPDSCSPDTVQQLEVAETKQIDYSSAAKQRAKFHRTLQQRRLRLRNLAMRNLKMELRWYRREQIREREYHKSEMKRIREESNRMEMERKIHRILNVVKFCNETIGFFIVKISDKVNEMSCNGDSDAELFNQCAQLEAQLSQSQNDNDVVILSDDSDSCCTDVAQQSEVAETKQIDYLSTAKQRAKSHRILQQRRLRLRNLAVRNLKVELRWYRKERIREREYHKSEMKRIRVDSNRMEMEKNRYRILYHLQYSLTLLLLQCYRSIISS